MTDQSTLSARLRRAADAIDLVTGLGFKVTGSPSMAITEDRPAPAKQKPAKAAKSRRFSYRQEVAKLLAESPGIKVSEICKRTGAAHSTVSSIIKKLRAEAAEADQPASETEEEQADDSEDESQPAPTEQPAPAPAVEDSPPPLSWLAARVQEIEAANPEISVVGLMRALGLKTPATVVEARCEIKRQTHGPYWPFESKAEFDRENCVRTPRDPNKIYKKRGRKKIERPKKILKRAYKSIEDPCYNMQAEYVSDEDDKRIQQEIAKRCEEVQATWSPHHRAKAAVCPIEKKRVLHSQGKSTCGFPHIHSTENCRWD